MEAYCCVNEIKVNVNKKKKIVIQRVCREKHLRKLKMEKLSQFKYF